eukprot:gnl/MRDRNA2_/MRDRNA2_120749_c0_seq1.p1 gnl/MRDRNA2_/MRDRNA2_120749_c0~~gnl/MRDRNA2_/MRDRNA2_120749_c0_seq1.p1  ORF type:complete len:597 (-),score=98.27 gnl/MRDRNA2_/MRDRNA2_120749_c0_seq1:93-1883(-)
MGCFSSKRTSSDDFYNGKSHPYVDDESIRGSQPLGLHRSHAKAGRGKHGSNASDMSNASTPSTKFGKRFRPQESKDRLIGVLGLDTGGGARLQDLRLPASRGYNLAFKTVHGLTYEAVRTAGMSTTGLQDKVKEELEFTVRNLEDMGVVGITANSVISLCIADATRKVAAVPVCLSPLMQCPMIAAGLSDDEQILVLTADVENLKRHKELLRRQCSFDLDDGQFWLYDINRATAIHSGGGEEHADPEQVTPTGVEALCDIVTQIVAENPQIKAILLETVELCSYAPQIRAAADISVFDAITCADFFISGARTDHLERHSLKTFKMTASVGDVIMGAIKKSPLVGSLKKMRGAYKGKPDTRAGVAFTGQDDVLLFSAHSSDYREGCESLPDSLVTPSTPRPKRQTGERSARPVKSALRAKRKAGPQSKSLSKGASDEKTQEPAKPKIAEKCVDGNDIAFDSRPVLKRKPTGYLKHHISDEAQPAVEGTSPRDPNRADSQPTKFEEKSKLSRTSTGFLSLEGAYEAPDSDRDEMKKAFQQKRSKSSNSVEGNAKPSNFQEGHLKPSNSFQGRSKPKLKSKSKSLSFLAHDDILDYDRE